MTDTGMKDLLALENLTELSLWGTKVADEGADAIRSALPECHINR